MNREIRIVWITSLSLPYCFLINAEALLARQDALLVVNSIFFILTEAQPFNNYYIDKGRERIKNRELTTGSSKNSAQWGIATYSILATIFISNVY
mgnify:CR=1